jgi:hypothetical protein
VSDVDASDFTEAGYRRALVLAKASYSFEPFGTGASKTHVLWRHDVDASVHRAARLSAIEAEEDVRATYFFSFHSTFYNLLERPVLDAAKAIVAAGHWVGLHFDSAFPGRGDVSERIAREATQLADLLEGPVIAFSFHNPGLVNDDLAVEDDSIAGLVNAYGRNIRAHYRYVSDSNGYWRHKRLFDVLEKGPPRLHVLTHPEWWQAQSMPPRQRIARCAEGRAQAALNDYDQALAAAGRENLGL